MTDLDATLEPPDAELEEDIAHRLEAANPLGQRTAHERIAALLMHVLRRCEQRGDVVDEEFAFPLSQQQIADSFHRLGLIPKPVTVRDIIWSPPS